MANRIENGANGCCIGATTEKQMSEIRGKLLRISSALDSIVCEDPGKTEKHLSLAFASDSVSREAFMAMSPLLKARSLIRDIGTLQGRLSDLTDMETVCAVCTRNGCRIATYSGMIGAYLGGAVALFMGCNPLLPLTAIAMSEASAGARECVEIEHEGNQDILRKLQILKETSGRLYVHALWVEGLAPERKEEILLSVDRYEEKRDTIRGQIEELLRTGKRRSKSGMVCCRTRPPSPSHR
ncbi:MAG: hypothetical protein OXF02_01625 [Simkaniaceae bacterium]|nr:hypothetical protein [Simkaniaceae bacterium]